MKIQKKFNKALVRKIENSKTVKNKNLLLDKTDSKQNTNIDYNKLKVEELKAELTKQNITIPKGAKKNDLIDLLTKNQIK